jgi:hypothetical protein
LPKAVASWQLGGFFPEIARIKLKAEKELPPNLQAGVKRALARLRNACHQRGRQNQSGQTGALSIFLPSFDIL